MQYFDRLVLSAFLTVTFAELIHENDVGTKSLQRSKRAETTYTTKYDNVDVDGILASTRLLRNYVNCLLDKGKCTAEGRELKKYLPEALATECRKCSPSQKKIAGKILSELLLHHREEFDLLAAKYDPEKKYISKYLSDDTDYEDYENA